MLGVLDSGEGGMNAVRYMSSLTQNSIIFYPDKSNAPYGKKCKEELTKIVSDGIDILLRCGADRILLACCTASTVYPYLSKQRQAVSTPIISPTLKAAIAVSDTKRLSLIATEATVNSRAFELALSDMSKKDECAHTSVFSLAAQELVFMVESGINDFTVTATDRLKIKNILSPLSNFNSDTLILGCTHFPSLERTISEIAHSFGIKNTVSSVKMGVDSFLQDINQKSNKCGRFTYLSRRI